jgi:hypothetical protein
MTMVLEVQSLPKGWLALVVETDRFPAILNLL